MLEAKNITYSLGTKRLLDDVSIQFLPAKLNLIIGTNGAGKSTLVKILCKQIQPQKGSVFYGGENLETLSVQALAQTRAVLSQNIELAFPLKVHEVVMMGRYPHFSGVPNEKDEVACEEAMRFFDIRDMATRDFTTLSGGEKQRVHFARVVAQIWYAQKGISRYLILDEPLTFLDVYYQYHFMNKIVELLKQENMVVVGVVHDLNLAAKFADSILLLHNGKVLSSGSKETVFTKENIREAYRLEPNIIRQNGALYMNF